MIQHSQPLPAGIPTCQPRHPPQLVRTRGAPMHDHRIGVPCADTWHMECHACGIATVPSTSRAVAEVRWRWPHTHIPLSQLRHTRENAAVSIAA